MASASHAANIRDANVSQVVVQPASRARRTRAPPPDTTRLVTAPRWLVTVWLLVD